MANCNEFLETFFATAKIGAVLVPLNIRLAPEELDFILKDCGVSEFIFGHAFEEKAKNIEYLKKVKHCLSTGPSSLIETLDYEDFIRQASDKEPSVPVEEKELLVIMYTSGTTGHPKGAMLTHAAMYSGGMDLAIGLHYQYPDRLSVACAFLSLRSHNTPSGSCSARHKHHHHGIL